MNDRAAQIVAGVVFMYMAWILTSVVQTLHTDRAVIYSLVDRVSALEEKHNERN